MNVATDRTTVLLVISFLGIFLLLGLVGLVYLIDRGTDAALIAIVSGPVGGALGGLTAMLVSTRSSPPAPTAEDLDPDA